MKMSHQVPAVVRLENAMKTTISHWCDEICRIVDEYGVKDLQNVLPLITDSLFELHIPAGWSLRTLTKAVNSRDFDMVANLLSPTGPVIRLCYKLLGDSTIKYEFPISFLPVATQHLLEEGVVPSFYSGKLQYHPQLRVPTCLVLNAFDYFMMHFLYYLVNPNLQKYATTSGGSDSVYFTILEDYLQYFMPANGSELEMIPAPSQSSPFGSPVFNSPPKQRFETSRPALTPSLLKKSSITPTTGTGTSSLSTERCFGQQDSWRTMTLLQAISELWLSHVASKESTNLQANSPHRTQINILQTSTFLPSLDHLRAVRMLTKHLHYFSNSMGPNIITGLDELKRTVWTYFQKKLYIFLRHTLEHWPLDASFRLFMETWLSYIQPWRYVLNGPPTRSNSDAGENNNKVVDPKWQTFVAENLLFYTLFLQKVILRFLRVDLSSPKTSLMLYRISKVYSQKNLKEMIAVAERSLGDGLPMSKSGGSSACHVAVSVRQFINELENPSFQFVPLFGQETTVHVRTVLAAAARAKSALRQMQVVEKPVETKAKGIWATVVDWFTYSGPAGGDENAEDVKKALNYLEQASSQLAAIFDVEMPTEAEMDQSTRSFQENVSMFRTPVRGMQSLNSSAAGATQRSIATPVNPTRRFDLVYGGNPDLKPICTYELAFLVRFFNQISTKLNEKLGPELEQWYSQADFTGRVIRQLLVPPVTYQEVIKSYGTPRTISKHLPPRICLRTLANKQLVGYTMGFFMLAYSLGWAPEILILLISCMLLAIVFVRASISTWRDEKRFTIIDTSTEG